MTGNTAAVVPVANFGAPSNNYNSQVQGGIDTEYSYGINTTGIIQDFAFANTIDIASIAGIDQLRGVDGGIFGYSDAFDVANLNIEQPQYVSNVGMAGATNFIGNIDVGQLPTEVDTALDASLADMEWRDDVAAGMPYWPAEYIADSSDEMI
jgi:hypothetical protein